MVVATELPADVATHAQAHGAVREAIEGHLAGRLGGVFANAQRRTEPIVFNAPNRPPLGFLFYDLAESDSHDFVKRVVHHAHADNLAALDRTRGTGLAPLGVMPHWLGSAQSNYSDGSPATLPRPARPPRAGRWAYTYTPVDQDLDFRRRLARASARSHVPVLVLDTSPDWRLAGRQAAKFADTNAQLAEMVQLLPGQVLPEWHATALSDRDAERLKLASPPDGRTRGHDESDHGLFIAGLVHDLAPGSRLSLRPVLNRYGVGDLHLLLQVLQDVVASKRPADPLVINMSLGFLPKMEHLAWLWYGVTQPNNPDFVPDVPIRGESHDKAWLAANREEVNRTTQLLHSGLEQMARYLLANNCLGVAAVGNDSQHRVELGRPRLGPRVPARYESVLGVAATTRDPSRAAAYSNVGDALEFGDHIATFGGDVGAGDVPRNGVIGVYTAPTFPRATSERGQPALPNNSGWATWSGTSFATGIASGLVAGYWGSQRSARPKTPAAEVLAAFNGLASDFAPALRTPSIEMTGAWERR
jgi:hypothetical protein